jgi:hypothetical protein
MSAVLGPIHHLMYERIDLASARQEDLAAFALARMSPGQREDLTARWSLRHELPQGGLEELIGDSPIHAWLQGQLESQLASEAQLWALLADRPERRRQVMEHLHEHGLRVGEALLTEEPAIATDARALLQQVDRILLQSMPCDRVSQVLAAGTSSYIVRRDLLFHAQLWARAGLAEETALACQESWVRGLYSAVSVLRFVRAEVSVDGRRLFDDRLSLNAVAQEA